MRAKEADSEEERSRSVLCASLEDPLRIAGIFAVGVFGVGFRGGVPAQGSAELAGSEGEDFGFFLGSIDTRWVHLDFP